MCSKRLKPLKELISRISSRIQLRHKLVVIICLSLSIYTLISSETLSLLIGFNRNYNTFNNNSNQTNSERKRGIRTNDENGNLVLYHLPNLTDYDINGLYYKQLTNGKHCFTSGTDWNQSVSLLDCICVMDYFGADCGIPSIVFNSQLRELKDIAIKRMSKPKRIVLSVILFPTHDSHAFITFLNNTFKLLSDLIDLFIIYEIKLIENYNKIIEKLSPNYGLGNKSVNGVYGVNGVNHSDHSEKNHNSFHLKDMLLEKELKQYSDIVLFDSIEVNSKQLVTIDANELQMRALSKLWATSVKRVTEFRPNDILIYMSSNSFPLKEIVMFLKHYEGFGEPIKLIEVLPTHNTNHFDGLYGPLLANNNNFVNIAVTFEYLSLLCRYDFDLFMRNQCINDEIYINKFISTYWPINLWTIGSNTSSATYTCSKCQHH